MSGREKAGLPTEVSDDPGSHNPVFDAGLDGRLSHLARMLGLDPLAQWILRTFFRLGHDRIFAQEILDLDSHPRPDILSWRHLAASNSESGAEAALRASIRSLYRWGLIQIVGATRGDPCVPGSTAMRLTAQGRDCIEGGPGADALPDLRQPLAPFDFHAPWIVIHSASREEAMLRMMEELEWPLRGPLLLPLRPDRVIREDTTELSRTCGRLACQLFYNGFAVLDAHPGGAHQDPMPWLEELIARTDRAPGARYLLVDDPSDVRYVAVATGAKLIWATPRTHMRRRAGPLSHRLSEALEAIYPESSVSDRCGVPDSPLAAPSFAQIDWGDLVLAEEAERRLKLCLEHARHRLVPQGGSTALRRGALGYRLLISGPPGTGKSMVAEAMATELKRPVVRVDLSTILSKWLGETEKLLGEIFDIAESAEAVLVMDEAEAIMQQRGQGQKGGGALSTGVAYLLTRLERYTGVLIATTNRTDDLDDAFFRRFDDYLVLSLPDVQARKQLWERMLAHHDQAAQVDAALLARDYPIGGALIRGTVLRALAWADQRAEQLDTGLIMASLVCELEKNNKASFEAMHPVYRPQVEKFLGRRPRS